jgi:uncharacterized protein YkwD
MTRINSPLARRALATLSILAILGASLLGPALASAAVSSVSPTVLTAQEAQMVAYLNADRAALGLVAVRPDSRLMAIARARSADMIAKGYFSHVQPDGRNVFDILTSAKIGWYGAGEIIAWNNYSMDTTASTANRQWMNSPGHKAIVISPNYNYVGVGLAIDDATGKKMWTAVYIKGPDRTGAKAKLGSPSISSGSTPSVPRINLAWWGGDVRLQVLTAGLHHYVIERSIDGGAWTLVTPTRGRELAIPSARGHLHQFRIAAIDRVGNRGAWSTTTVDLR